MYYRNKSTGVLGGEGGSLAEEEGAGGIGEIRVYGGKGGKKSLRRGERNRNRKTRAVIL